ncbi:hypothetical protein [Arthrobacter sp. ISL-65]|uniref:hypothetical protein n=1 Tax=Arthrobacter sp. ISL-65 TaxID=2819112 RepID=UPI001BE4E255|nr:hypothetical protein [Arthrobacter sp. ISL-65]MBT2549580.1 hypothetical protein [Arthrobacter sp. ISL-65]
MHRPSRGIRVPRSCGRDLPALVRSHTALDADEGDLFEIDGLRLTSVARTWVDLGSVLPTDLGCVRFRTCIEYEKFHHLTPAQQALDAYRDQRVTDAGWRQVKVNSIDMGHGRDWVVSRVRQALRKQGWQR